MEGRNTLLSMNVFRRHSIFSMIPIDEDDDVPISEVSNESANDSSDGEGAGEAENEEGSQSKKFLNYKPTTKMPRRRTAKPARSQSSTRSSLSDTTSSESFQHQDRGRERTPTKRIIRQTLV